MLIFLVLFLCPAVAGTTTESTSSNTVSTSTSDSTSSSGPTVSKPASTTAGWPKVSGSTSTKTYWPPVTEATSTTGSTTSTSRPTVSEAIYSTKTYWPAETEATSTSSSSRMTVSEATSTETYWPKVSEASESASTKTYNWPTLSEATSTKTYWPDKAEATSTKTYWPAEATSTNTGSEIDWSKVSEATLTHWPIVSEAAESASTTTYNWPKASETIKTKTYWPAVSEETPTYNWPGVAPTSTYWPGVAATPTYSYSDQLSWPNLCLTGTSQSPINIKEISCMTLYKSDFPDLPTVPVAYNLKSHNIQFDITEEVVIKMPERWSVGHTRGLQLLQLHFHWGTGIMDGSEHSVMGYQMSGEVHLVTRNLDYNPGDPEGEELAVFGAFLVDGSYGEMGRDEWWDLPIGLKTNEIDLFELFDADEGVLTYHGSLTTPPCTESVFWQLKGVPVIVSVTIVTILLPSSYQVVTIVTMIIDHGNSL
eukprot:sb/3464277/